MSQSKENEWKYDYRKITTNHLIIAKSSVMPLKQVELGFFKNMWCLNVDW